MKPWGILCDLGIQIILLSIKTTRQLVVIVGSFCAKAEYAYLLRMAAESNHNYIRIWGGGGIEKEEFYDIADSLGIMVYQEMVHSQAIGWLHEGIPNWL